MGTAIVLLILLTFIILAIKNILKKKSCSCGSGCDSCSGCKVVAFKNSLNELKHTR